MIDRVRLLLDRPLDPTVARAVTVIASAIFVGVAALFVLSDQEDGGTPPVERVSLPPSIRLAQPPGEDLRSRRQASRAQSGWRQDPQDVKGSRAARRAGRALRAHSALQHVPYRVGELAIELVGARRHRAVVRVTAPTLAYARAGWRAFLRRYHDAGRAYVPVFMAQKGRTA